MDVIIVPLINILIIVIDLYLKLVFIAVIISWLIGFGVLNTSNRIVYAICNFFRSITEPLFRKIDSVIPPIGQISISPIILILGCLLLRDILVRLLLRM